MANNIVGSMKRPVKVSWALFFLLALLLQGHAATGLLIRGYNASNHELFATEKNQQPTDVSLTVLAQTTYMLVGNGPKELEVWIPEGWGPIYDPKPFVVACALHDIAVRYPNITARLKIVGWAVVGDVVICDGKTEGLPCPDVIILGTTQIAGRFYSNDLEPLENYFSKYALDTGRNLIDDFYKGSYYDFRVGDTWTGVPVWSDVRALIYNRTLFKELGLKEPPPLQSWGEYDEEWTWDKYIEYAKVLKDAGSKPIQILTHGNEEFHNHMVPLGRLANAPLVESDGSCGLRRPAFKQVWEKYMREPLANGLANHQFDEAALMNSADLKPWLTDLNPNSDIVAQVPKLGALSTLATWGRPAPDGMGTGPIGGVYVQWLRNPKDVGYGYPPGFFTFLGGSGAVIPRHSKQKDMAWEFIAHLLNRTESFIRRLNWEGSIPPLESHANHPDFNSTFFEFARNIMRRAVPNHYPGIPWRFYKALGTVRPFRMMMLEHKYKNFTTDVVIDRACKVIEFLAQRNCDANDYEPIISDCLVNNTKIMSFRWKEPSNCKLGALTLPHPVYNIECSYIVPSSSMAIGIGVVTALGTATSAFYAIAFMIFKEKPAVKAASFVFCEAIFLGSILLYISVFLQSGEPSASLCLARPWFLALGFGLLLGGLLVKMLQIKAIFVAQVSAKHFDKNNFTLLKMLQRLAFVLFCEVAVLIALSVVESPGVISKKVELRGVGTYLQQECSNFNQITIVALIGINAVLIIYSSYTAWQSRKVPDAFNETKFVAVAILLISFTAIVILPVVMTVGTVVSQYLLISLAINFATTVSMGIFAVPKVYAAYYNIKARTSTFGTSSDDKGGILRGTPKPSAGNSGKTPSA
ncbi:hypothetical protein HK102_013855 [Quaeritorhiza haematococci]|nr:hypothetical protein HK102_013855 [Quaeritorhiza haematococci]